MSGGGSFPPSTGRRLGPPWGAVPSAGSYREFLASKAQLDGATGADPVWMHDGMFPFQQVLTAWALRQGRAALFEDCGLGKTLQQLVWTENVRRLTGRPVLILTPLAVSAQTVAEAEKFGIEAAVSRDGRVAAGITVTNYDRLHLFQAEDYGGGVCDESSAIKAFDGERRAAVTEFMRRMRFRLLCTATAAPNDYIELGTSSEALGYLGHMDMLGRFFTNDQRASRPNRNWDGAGWRFKGHAEEPFWRWVASWARAMRKPSDLGFSDDGFQLPPLEYRQHVVTARTRREDMLFDLPANGLREEREELRRTLVERCERAAELTQPHDVSIAWCQLNDEGDLLERLIPRSIQVKGSDTDEWKEAAVAWFTGRLCICNHELFRHKLAAWRRDLTVIGKSITPPTESSGLPSRTPTSAATPTSDVSTCADGMNAIASESASTARLQPTGAILGAANNTRAIPPSDPRSSRRSAPGSSPIRPSASLSDSGASDSRQTSTGSSSSAKAEAVPSAEGFARTAACASIIATPKATSGDCYATPATLDSASSRMILAALSEPPCICGHRDGRRRLVSKPVMFGWGLNLQHCHHMTVFPAHSYEQFYQAVRRCWRFGQEYTVGVDIVTTEGGANALKNLERKAAQADRMFDALVAHMQDALSIRRSEPFRQPVEVPTWLAS